MLFTASDRIFDTLIDTQQKRVTMIKTKLYLRLDSKSKGPFPLYMHITGGGFTRERFPLDIYLEEKQWDKKKCEIIGNDSRAYDLKLILENVDSKLTDIKTVYRLSDKTLTPKILREEYEGKLSRVNFVAFFLMALNEEKSKMCAGSYGRHHSVYLKLQEYQNYIPFNTITLSWLNKYRNYLKETKKNADTTINSNFASIKKFLGISHKHGIKLLFDIEDIKIGDTKGNRSYLNSEELSKCIEFYFCSYIKPQWRLVLGYFLFSCMNGLRISNVQGLQREQLLGTDFSIILVKGNKDRLMKLNLTAKKIIAHDKDLFVKRITDKDLNLEIKKIMIFLVIKKHVSFHVARHTFATLFLKAGGKVERLQMILGHKTISQTMIYSHIVQEEANEEMFLLDNLFLNAV